MLLTDEERTERERMNKAFTDRHDRCNRGKPEKNVGVITVP